MFIISININFSFKKEICDRYISENFEKKNEERELSIIENIFSIFVIGIFSTSNFFFLL